MLYMTVPVEKHLYTIAEYLAMEEGAEIRHEYHDGEILAMSGGTYRHSKIVTNLIVALGSRLRGRSCDVLDSNMRVRIPRRGKYVYPDASIVCGGPQFDVDDPKQTTIVNPRAVFEVLSESTALYDRSDKFQLYGQVPSLEEYVLVSQAQAKIETFIRQLGGNWLYDPKEGLEAVLDVRSAKLTIPLAEIFEGVTFDPPSAPKIAE